MNSPARINVKISDILPAAAVLDSYTLQPRAIGTLDDTIIDNLITDPNLQRQVKALRSLVTRVLLPPEIPTKIDTKGSMREIWMLCKDMEALDQEELRVVCVNYAGEVTHILSVYRGTANEIGVRHAEILRPVVITNSPYFIMVHNHPGGNPAPSEADIATTRALSSKAKALDITLLDSLVIGRDRYLSLRQLGAF